MFQSILRKFEPKMSSKINLLFLFVVAYATSVVLAYPSRFSSKKSDYMELKVKPKPFQVAVDNPEDVQEMVVKDVTNQKRVLIVAKNPASFELGSSVSRPVGGYFAPSSRDRYEFPASNRNSDAIRAYYEDAARNSGGYWKGSVLPASVN